MKRTIWTYSSTPFIMGGEVNKVISTEVDMIEEKKIGKGFLAFSFKTPKGTLRIAESITGAIVGDSWEGVKMDMTGADKKTIEGQIEDAKKDAKRARKLTYTKFFEKYNY